METPYERVWALINEVARDFAAHGIRRTERQAHSTVAQLVSAAAVRPQPPAHIMAFYAAELLRMIDGHKFDNGK